MQAHYRPNRGRNISMLELAKEIEKLILAYEEQTGKEVRVVRWGIGLNPVLDADGNLSEGNYKLTWADENERHVSIETI